LSDLISQFVGRYRREYDYFEFAAKLVHAQLESALSSSGIRAMVTYRAKRPERLEAKLRQRNQAKSPYANDEQIYDDIVDLAGVRVALYFPGSVEEVDKAIRANFDMSSEVRKFPLNEGSSPRPFNKRFDGYRAQHYRIRLRESDLQEPQKRYAKALVEIQVASVLMHAWSEVEHDLIYKPLQGTLSEDEYAILDELNGLVMAGEIALERLQRASETRVTQAGAAFESHYDLAAYLLKSMGPVLKTADNQSALGHVDLLYELLVRLSLNSQDYIQSLITSLHADVEKRSIADQIVDLVLAADENRYSVYAEIRGKRITELSNATDRSKEVLASGVLHAFLQEWIEFEKVAIERAGSSGTGKESGRVAIKRFLSDQNNREIERISALRNKTVHGRGMPDWGDIREATKSLKRIVQELRSKEQQQPTHESDPEPGK